MVSKEPNAHQPQTTDIILTMEQEEFMRLAKAKEELESFLDAVQNEGFDAIGARGMVLCHVCHLYITDKELVDAVTDFLQEKLNDINKRIEEL